MQNKNTLVAHTDTDTQNLSPPRATVLLGTSTATISNIPSDAQTTLFFLKKQKQYSKSI